MQPQRLAVALAALVLCAQAAGAATYYIDAVNGLNSNNGTSLATAWQTPPGSSCECTTTPCPIRQCLVNSIGGWPAGTKIHAGDQLFFLAGQSHSWALDVNATYYDTNAASDIIFSGYDPVGGQQAPVIEGGADPTTLQERATPNFFPTVATNIYSFNFNCSRFNDGTGATDGVQTMRNGVRFGAGRTSDFYRMDADGVASCTGLTKPYSQYLDCANNRVCLYLPSGINPNNDPAGTWYVGWRNAAMYLRTNMAHLRIQGFTMRRKGTRVNVGGGEIECEAATPSGSNTGGGQNNLTVQGNTFAESGGTGLRCSMDNFLAQPCLAANQPTNLNYNNNVAHDNWSYGMEISGCDNSNHANWQVVQNQHYHNGDHGLQCSGTYGCVIDQNISFENGVGNSQCGVTGQPCGPDQERTGTGMNVSGSRNNSQRWSQNSQVTRNRLYGNGYGCKQEANPSDSLCAGSSCNGACSGIYSDSVVGTGNVYANNVIYNNWGSCIAFNSAGNSVGAVYKLYNNSCSNDGMSELFDFNGGWAANQFDVQNNIWAYALGVAPVWYNVFWKSSTTQIFSNNDTFNAFASTRQFFCNGTAQATPCAFGTASGNFQTDPKYTSATNLVPQAGSPVIGTGANTSPTVTLDFAGVTRGLPYDVGAYQVGATSGTTSTSTSTSSSTIASTTTTTSSTSTTLPPTGAGGMEPDRGPKFGGPP